MNSFFGFLNSYGMGIMFLLQFAMGWFVLVLKDKFAPKSLADKVDVLEEKITIIEVRMENIPMAEDLHSLEKALCDLRGDMKADKEARAAASGYLTRLEEQVNRMDEFWRTQNGK